MEHKHACFQCPAVYRTKEWLDEHIWDQHSIAEHCCEICNYKTSSGWDLARHIPNCILRPASFKKRTQMGWVNYNPLAIGSEYECRHPGCYVKKATIIDIMFHMARHPCTKYSTNKDKDSQ
jgi:hypothetical protein